MSLFSLAGSHERKIRGVGGLPDVYLQIQVGQKGVEPSHLFPWMLVRYIVDPFSFACASTGLASIGIKGDSYTGWRLHTTIRVSGT